MYTRVYAPPTPPAMGGFWDTVGAVVAGPAGLVMKSGEWLEEGFDWVGEQIPGGWEEVGNVVACKLPTGAIVGGVAGAYFSGGVATAAGATAGGALQAALAGHICPPGAAKVVVPAAQLPPPPPPPPPPPKWYQTPEAPPLIVGGVVSLFVIGLALKRRKRK